MAAEGIKWYWWVLLITLILAIILVLYREEIREAFHKTFDLTWDNKTDKTIAKLHPMMRQSAISAINELDHKYKIKVRAYSGLRSFDEQQTLYDKGRITAGKIVTNAKPGSSFHNYGLAFDVVEIKNKKALWSGPNWEKIAEVFKRHGFEWGGDWTSFKDKPHFQMPFGKTTSQLLALHNKQMDANQYVNLA